MQIGEIAKLGPLTVLLIVVSHSKREPYRNRWQWIPKALSGVIAVKSCLSPCAHC